MRREMIFRFGGRRRSAPGLAGAAALALLLAACGANPATVSASPDNPTLTVTLASLGRAPELRDLKGMAPAQVAALIGDPDFRRSDPPAEIWQYRSADCVLDLFFYSENSDTRLVYSETRSRNPQRGTKAAAACADAGVPLGQRLRQTKL